MHDAEQETFVLKTMPEQFCELLEKIGIQAQAKEIATDEAEKGDYYSRHFTQTPRMVTNKGCVDLHGTSIDVVHIIQKG